MIYLDYAAATPVDKKVLASMQSYFSDDFANPSSKHEQGKKALCAVEKARASIAAHLHCSPQEIIFTSGGTESNALALQGVAQAKKKGHIITTQIEHKSVLATCNYLEKKGFDVTYLPVTKQGLVRAIDLKKALRHDTILVSIIYANNEMGVVQPIAQLAKVVKAHATVFHTDACQAAAYLDLDVKKLGVDLLTLNAAKIYGPKGAGVLYKRDSVVLSSQLYGGQQEFSLRPGTQNVPAIVGCAQALAVVQKRKEKEIGRLTSLRDWFISEVVSIPQTVLNGHATKRLPNNVNISFADVSAEQVVAHLDHYGVCVSAGSACTAQEIMVSHVIAALNSTYPQGAVRFTFGKQTTKKDLVHVIGLLKKIIPSLRAVG